MDLSPPVIIADHLYKSYRPKAHQISLRHEATRLLKRSLHRRQDETADVFWALHDVSFSIQEGESVALIGRNGSGKTTLLRILSGITRPARGHAAVCGRFATLIALGAGFNVERTGRENIFLNAAIQGVPPRLAAQYIDDIVHFAELGEFIDVPVKRYSSGMVTRLGFSIAAHIFPDIIFIDEVLAVGDQGFQEKCIDRIKTMKNEGRTLLFVSHARDTVRDLCERSIWLHHGHLQMDGPTDDVLNAYDAMLHT
jgi:lipopolysaccharide transport system ATP-binding protein